jgi:hypothetical protein
MELILHGYPEELAKEMVLQFLIPSLETPWFLMPSV